MDPLKIEDFLPLLELKMPMLNKVVSEADVEADQIPEGNRIYFISKQLGVSACPSVFVRSSSVALYSRSSPASWPANSRRTNS